MSNPLQVATNRALPFLPNDQSTLVKNLWRGVIDEPRYIDEMLSNGKDTRNAQEFKEAQFTLLDSQEALNLFRRGLLGDTPQSNREEFDKKMASIGFTPTVINEFVKANEVIESPQQIVTFLVREVLSPELRAELELDAEFPESAIPEFLKIGIPEKLARKIWAAHWTLPDVGTMQTALHRYGTENKEFWQDEITQQGLDPNKVETSINDISQLLKFQDVGTRYRQQVLSTLFNDAGQIQLRWLIRFGFIDFRRAVYMHERQGLPKTIAEQVTKVVFVVQSITDWRTAIKVGVMTFDDVKEKMAEWQITEPNIINIVKLKVAPDEIEAVIEEKALSKKLIRDAWELGEFDRSEAIQALRDLGNSEDQAKLIFEVWEADNEIQKKKEAKRSGLSKSDIKRGFRLGEFSGREAVDRLVEIGMNKDAAQDLIDIERQALG